MTASLLLSARHLFVVFQACRRTFAAALEWTICTPGEAGTAALLATSMSRFWYLQCQFREGIGDGSEKDLRFLTNRLTPRPVVQSGITALGSMYWVMGHYDSAQANYERHLDISRELGDNMALGSALMNLGLVAMHRGEYPLARSRMERRVSACYE